MTDFRFDEEKHEYFVDGVRWPGINELFKEQGLVDTTWYKPEHSQRGKAVHLMCALHDLNQLEEILNNPQPDKDTDYRPFLSLAWPYLPGWTKFLAETGFKPEIIERPGYVEPHRFCGTLDRAGKLLGSPAIVEIKTGAPHCAVRLQTAGHYLLTSMQYPRRFVVQLKPDGTYKLHPEIPLENLERDCEELISMVRTHWLRREGK